MIAMKILTSSVIIKSAKKKKTWGEANCAPQTLQVPLDSYQPPPFVLDLFFAYSPCCLKPTLRS